MKRLPFEDEIDAWIDRNVGSIPIDMARKYYKQTVTRDTYDFHESINNIDFQAEQNLEYLLFAGIRMGEFDINSPLSPSKFEQFMEEAYLPAAKELHINTTNWFVERLQHYDMNLYMELELMGADWGRVEYEGTDAKLRKFGIYNGYGIRIATIEYDPSHNVFYAFYVEA